MQLDSLLHRMLTISGVSHHLPIQPMAQWGRLVVELLLFEIVKLRKLIWCPGHLKVSGRYEIKCYYCGGLYLCRTVEGYKINNEHDERTHVLKKNVKTGKSREYMDKNDRVT